MVRNASCIFSMLTIVYSSNCNEKLGTIRTENIISRLHNKVKSFNYHINKEIKNERLSKMLAHFRESWPTCGAYLLIGIRFNHFDSEIATFMDNAKSRVFLGTGKVGLQLIVLGCQVAGKLVTLSRHKGVASPFAAGEDGFWSIFQPLHNFSYQRFRFRRGNGSGVLSHDEFLRSFLFSTLAIALLAFA